MAIKLTQSRFLKGTREFEIIDDTVHVRIKGLLKEEKLTVGLSIIDPEPVVNGSEMIFYGSRQREPLLSLILDNPDSGKFNAFVDALRQGAFAAHSPFAADATASPESSQPEAPGWNVYEEPPAFEESDESREDTGFRPVNPERVDEDITMLKTYLDEDAIRPLIDALEALRAEPGNEGVFQQVVDTYNTLGINQGAVLTYAPYLKVLLSGSMWMG